MNTGSSHSSLGSSMAQSTLHTLLLMQVEHFLVSQVQPPLNNQHLSQQDMGWLRFCVCNPGDCFRCSRNVIRGSIGHQLGIDWVSTSLLHTCTRRSGSLMPSFHLCWCSCSSSFCSLIGPLFSFLFLLLSLSLGFLFTNSFPVYLCIHNKPSILKALCHDIRAIFSKLVAHVM